jgi:hypothetical protein
VYSTKLIKNKNRRGRILHGTGKDKKGLGLTQIFLTKREIMKMSEMAEYGLRDLGLIQDSNAVNSLGIGMDQEMGVLEHGQ